MNVNEYISSGILEAYALGDLSVVERQQVEQMLLQHSEIREELLLIESSLEQLAFKGAITPKTETKQKLIKSITVDGKQTKVVSIAPVKGWSWATAASVVFALVASYLAYDYRDRWITTTVALNELINRNEEFAQNYNQINLKLQKLQGDFGIIENASFSKIILKGTANSPESLASVYWNQATEEAYLSIQTLKQLSQEQQFQLWAIVDGQPVDIGVFDSGFVGLLTMKNVKNASAFAVTIEPRGGRPSPTLETMQVLGTIVRG